MAKITCPRCKQSEEGFTVVLNVFVTAEIDCFGEQKGGADYANEGRYRWINCEECGHSWRTARGLAIDVDVR